MNIQTIRRARLAQLIRDRFEGSQAKFIEITGENQGEVSALLRDKSFGEKKARKIESKCDLAQGWLDVLEGDTASSIRLSAPANVPPGRWIAITGIVQGKSNGDVSIEPCPPGEDDWTLYSFSSESSTYALRMQGDEMRPRIKHAEYLIVEPDAQPLPGDDVLVSRRDGSWLIRELLWIRDDETYLGSINHGCPPITLLQSKVESIHRISVIVPRGSTLLRKG